MISGVWQWQLLVLSHGWMVERKMASELSQELVRSIKYQLSQKSAAYPSYTSQNPGTGSSQFFEVEGDPLFTVGSRKERGDGITADLTLMSSRMAQSA